MTEKRVRGLQNGVHGFARTAYIIQDILALFRSTEIVSLSSRNSTEIFNETLYNYRKTAAAAVSRFARSETYVVKWERKMRGARYVYYTSIVYLARYYAPAGRAIFISRWICNLAVKQLVKHAINNSRSAMLRDAMYYVINIGQSIGRGFTTQPLRFPLVLIDLKRSRNRFDQGTQCM